MGKDSRSVADHRCAAWRLRREQSPPGSASVPLDGGTPADQYDNLVWNVSARRGFILHDSRYVLWLKQLKEQKLSREEAASQLQSLAAQLRSDTFDLEIDDTTKHLTLPEDVNLEIGLRERSSRLRGNRASITVKMDWRPPDADPEE